MQNLKVSIIIPNYSGRELLLKNLQSVIEASANKANNIQEIIIVDDASKDDSVDLINNKFHQVILIKHKINRGFSASVNTGARAAKGNLLALINTDVAVSRDFLVNILPHFENERIFAVSMHERGFGWARGFFEKGFINHEQGNESETVHKTFWVSGGSGVYRRDYWMDLGGMDEKLLSPFYWEDIDICYRAAKRGWLNIWEPNSYVTHKHESTVSKISVKFRKRIQERNQLIFIWKNITSPVLTRKHLRGLAERIIKHPGYLRIVCMALIKRKAIKKARLKEVKEAHVSDEALFEQFSNA